VKSEWTKAERGFDFEYASTVFLYDKRIEQFSRHFSEDRFLAIGMTPANELITVIDTWRQHDEEQTCRIISARKAHKKNEADIKAYIKSPKFEEDAARSRSHGLGPTAADIKKDIPALTDQELSRLYRPVKALVTVRIDGEILAWLKSKGGRYQTHLNATLRAAMISERKR
jgi:uncharacterized protein (DUF4415 family)